MIETNVFHALGLHMHQPPGNLELLINANPWEAEQIIRCYERPARYAQRYADVGHLHIGFSGILLEQLRDPDIIDRYRHIIDIPAMFDAYRETPNVELIGMGYFHPIFPLIPSADWADHLQSGREIMAECFGRAPRGFWPPEMAFAMEMIPALVRAGYEYVVVDGVHVHPEDGVSDVFRPYLACHDGVCICVVPRDRIVSNAQESGLDAAWFAHEVTHRCRFSPRPHEARLVTTWSDGENGGWFRQMHEGSGFFGHYFAPYMEHVRGGEYPVRPVGLSSYLAEHEPTTQAMVQTGAWNVGSTSGFDFSQWAGSPGQQRAGEAVTALSRHWWRLSERAADMSAAVRAELALARRQVLEAQTSCYLFWGDDWLPKLDVLVQAAAERLTRIESGQVEPPAAATTRAPRPAPTAPAAAAATAADNTGRSTAPARATFPLSAGSPSGAKPSGDDSPRVASGPSAAELAGPSSATGAAGPAHETKTPTFTPRPAGPTADAEAGEPEEPAPDAPAAAPAAAAPASPPMPASAEATSAETTPATATPATPAKASTAPAQQERSSNRAKANTPAERTPDPAGQPATRGHTASKPRRGPGGKDKAGKRR